MTKIDSLQNNQNVTWVCPFCDKHFKWFEVLDTDEYRAESLVPHLYLSHEGNLTVRRIGNE